MSPVDSRIACRKNIGKEKHLLVGKPFRYHSWPKVGIGNPHVLRLPAVIAAIKVGVAEKRAAFFCKHASLRTVMVGIAVLAVSRKLMVAEVTGTAGDRERDYDAVTRL
ncbi:hypothetical protein D3C80_1230850 [compost metagenome]